MFPHCQDRDDLRAALERELEALPGERRRLFLFHELPDPAAFGSNPVWEGLQRQHSALHEAMVVDPETWARHCPRADHGHVLVGPVVQGGELIGAVAVTRTEGPFTDGDLLAMNHLCLHFSLRWAELPERATGLTPREQDVTRAVCRGLRNAEVARELLVSEHTVKQNLKSIFRKLGIRSRTELVQRMAGVRVR